MERKLAMESRGGGSFEDFFKMEGRLVFKAQERVLAAGLVEAAFAVMIASGSS